jgi:hypothetical protein
VAGFVGLIITQLTLGTYFPSGPGALDYLAIVGGCSGLVVGGALHPRTIRQSGAAIVAWIFVCGITGTIPAIAASLIASGTGEALSIEVTSSLGWGAAGFVGGLWGYVWSRYMDEPEVKRGEAKFLVALGWGLALALCAGIGLGGGLRLGRMFFGAGMTAQEVSEALPQAMSIAACIGIACGLVVGLVSWQWLGKNSNSADRLTHAIVWTAGCGIATSIGGVLSVLCVVAAGKLLPVEVSASVGFASAGLIIGIGGYILSPRPKPLYQPELDEEETSQPPGEGEAYLPAEPPQPRRTTRRPSLLRLLPVFAISLSTLVTAAFMAPSDTALVFLAIGLLGLSIVPVLWDQERRIIALERRLHAETPP